MITETRRTWVISAVMIIGVATGTFVTVAPASAAVVYTVTSTGDETDAVPGDGICRSSVGTCTLRAAVIEDQRDGDLSTISFDIAGAGPHTISLNSSLPTLAAGGTTVDGYSQPGSAPNTDPLVSNAALKIQVRGAVSGGPEGFVVTSANNVVRGLAFFDLYRAVRMTGTGATGNAVVGNFIGTDAAAGFSSTTANSNSFGVVVTLGASWNSIGRPSLPDRNVISGNAGRGVLICSTDCTSATGANDNSIQNNLVGLNASGTAALPNLGHGIDINAGSSRNLVGGTGLYESNVVSGNRGSGVEVSHGSATRWNNVVGNKIGTNPGGTGSADFTRNGQPNVRIEDHVVGTLVSDNIIGGSTTGGIKIDRYSNGTRVVGNRIGVSGTGVPISNGPFGVRIELGSNSTRVGPNNIIANNAAGVQIFGTDTRLNTVTRNSIHNNDGLGIDISPLGSPNPNDAGDGDAGPNDLLNWPELRSATADSVNAVSCAGCHVEVFLADTTSAGSYGEGETFLGSSVADETGTATIALPAAAAGRMVTATATDSLGNTSEFSLNVLIPSESTTTTTTTTAPTTTTTTTAPTTTTTTTAPTTTTTSLNSEPAASFTYVCDRLTCRFDGSGSQDVDGRLTSYQWNFGDGTSASGDIVNHTFPWQGWYSVRLTVTDDDGSSSTSTQLVRVKKH